MMLKTCSFAEFSHNLLLVEFVSCLIVWGECSEDVLMYNKLLLGFLQGVYKPVIKFNVTFEHFYDINILQSLTHYTRSLTGAPLKLVIVV